MHVPSSFPTSDRSIRWIENLAEQELSAAGERASYDLCSTRDEIQSLETVGFLNELRYHFEYLIRLFNSKLGKGGIPVKVARGISSDHFLSLFRNGIVLQIDSKKMGSIHLTCQRRDEQNHTSSVLTSGFVEAEFSSFHELQWFFLREPVTSEKVACHFLTEFLQLSRTQN